VVIVQAAQIKDEKLSVILMFYFLKILKNENDYFLNPD